MSSDLFALNPQGPSEALALIEESLRSGEPAIVTSNFRPFAAVMLHLVTRVAPTIPVVWMDSGYNTAETYRHAEALRAQLDLNLRVYTPRRTRARREALDGPPPGADDPRFDDFVREVKLEPFERALAELRPKVWFNGVRASDTAQRATMAQVERNADGILKVAPLLHWTSRDLHHYLQQHGLPNNWDYVDPTKPDPAQECGLHVAH
ncbi:phosphoadenosine phosphosulfate reductase domain-containing protein [Solimonas variicoloris]|uniref:phosphoadenosine phosphosulfate reductase domain-containing protein n=1 Tax=Solimonas variicoloris TaxID=254408 RepID=UPI00035F1F6A|nr:phosphoadenosine phosphosulfate reductase family protein [Solimonas variicoloris]